MPAARLANGARSPPTFHINGIHRQTPEMQTKDDIDSPVMITSGKFSPPPYLFEGLRNPFSDPWCSDTSKEDGTSLNSIGMKELSKDSTLERHVQIKTGSLEDECVDDGEVWPLPPSQTQPSSEPPKQKPPLAPKPPIPPKIPVSTPYAVPSIIPSTSSTLTRKVHHSQYAQPSIQANASSGNNGTTSNGESTELSPITIVHGGNTNGLDHSMLSEIDKTYKQITDQKFPPEILTKPSPHSPLSPIKIHLKENLSYEQQEPPPPPPPPPPPLPPATLPISPLSSPPTTPQDSPPSSPALSPPTSSSTSDSQPSSSPNSPPHYLLNWR